jgi:hypothetical protein
MDKLDFIKKTQKFLALRFSSKSYDLYDKENFGLVEESYTLEDKQYQVFNFKFLTGFKPNKSRPELLIYTFFILRPLNGVKEKFLEEVEKQESGQPFNKEIIGSYYSPFFPELLEFKKMTIRISDALEKVYYPGKGYEFVFDLVTITKDYDMVLAFIEIGSLKKLDITYPDKVVFDPD